MPDPNAALYEQAMDEITAFGQADTRYVKDEITAGYALLRLAKMNAEDAAVRSQAGHYIEQVNAWEKACLESHNSGRNYLEHELVAFVANQRQHDKRYKLDTPFGKVTVTVKKTATVHISDPDQLLDFVKHSWDEDTQAEVITRKESIKLADLKPAIKIVGDKVVDENGEAVPGLEVQPVGTETPNIKPAPIVKEL